MSSRRAIYLDRDGTLVHPRHYPRRPEDLRLYAGLPRELRALQRKGFALVVITNQSGIARGLITEEELDRMHAGLCRQLHSHGVALDAFYHCPHHPEGSIDALSIACECRKPRPGMLLRAAEEMNIDLARSWFAGDILDDVEAGNRAGCTTVLIDQGTESRPRAAMRRPDYVTASTLEALRLIRWVERIGPPVETSYIPAAWSHRRPSSGASRKAVAGAV